MSLPTPFHDGNNSGNHRLPWLLTEKIPSDPEWFADSWIYAQVINIVLLVLATYGFIFLYIFASDNDTTLMHAAAGSSKKRKKSSSYAKVILLALFNVSAYSRMLVLVPRPLSCWPDSISMNHPATVSVS